MSLRISARLFASAFFLLAAAASALSPVNKSFLGGVAIDGYDPVAYFTDGKLYLNYNLEVKAMWDKDVPGYIAQGDQNWPKLVGAQ